jgi:hypothetical protein
MLTPRRSLPPRATLAVAFFAFALAAFSATGLNAQNPGLWRYVIMTDLAAVPADMRVNFPTVRFDACLTEEDFASGRAFSIQPTPGSLGRCQTMEVTRNGAEVSLRFACDEGKTLSGSARGTVSARRFEMQIENRYEPAVSGVGATRQTMQAVRVGGCPSPR